MLQLDAQEAVDKLRTVERVLLGFKTAFLMVQKRGSNRLRLPSPAFTRLDAMLQRCRDLLALKLAMLQFARLDRIEIGGTKVERPIGSMALKGQPCLPLGIVLQGKTLTAIVKTVFNDFNVAAEKMTRVECEAFDLHSPALKADLTDFCATVEELDQRLVAIVLQVHIPPGGMLLCRSLFLIEQHIEQTLQNRRAKTQQQWGLPSSC